MVGDGYGVAEYYCTNPGRETGFLGWARGRRAKPGFFSRFLNRSQFAAEGLMDHGGGEDVDDGEL